ncbi:MAG TPA: ABC transporter ATP-binding protein [Bacillota bacterium]|nr:ABC transporter ATP-binding protein [Clostridiales bacterium]HPT84657.1 ABC transporter ATP-binding protein [Bacillota bacterium]
MATLLSVKDMNVYYGVIHAVKGVSFDVEEGEIVTLIGANGAGKSTILKTISGMLRSKTGSIAFDGKDISNIEPYKLLGMGIAHVPEGRCIFQRLTVEENLEMGGYISKPAEVAAAIENVYNLFPRLKERRRQIAGTLSGGEQQMLAIGRAMMTKPRLIMMDEPSMGLAPILVQQIFQFIKELNASGTTILLVEQNAHMALRIANRGYVLETGRIVLEGKASELLTNESVKKAYLGG